MIVDPHPAYVLHAQPYRETSLLLDVFSRDHGRVGLVARGVRGTRAQPTRVLLQPLQPLLLGWGGRGELLQLRALEAAGAALKPEGDALLGAFYLNELLVRLLPRGEPNTALFWRYAECVGALSSGEETAWQLRRFERDLLAALGYALRLEHEADGDRAIDPDTWYRYDVDAGAWPLPGRLEAAISGTTLLDLAQDQRPDPEGMRQLRSLMRRILLHHLGGRELRSWQLLADLAAQRRER